MIVRLDAVREEMSAVVFRDEIKIGNIRRMQRGANGRQARIANGAGGQRGNSVGVVWTGVVEILAS